MSMYTPDADILGDGRSNFATKVRPCRYSFDTGKLRLSVTHNGTHWLSIELSYKEARAVIAALQQALKEHEEKKP
jgi:hypothetical protein